MKQPRKQKSVNAIAIPTKPRVKFMENSKIVIDNVVPNNTVRVIEALNTSTDWLLIALIVVRQRLASCEIMDSKAVDGSNITK